MAKDPQNITIGDRQLTCKHCGHDEFTGRKAQLNTALSSFFEVDFLNKSAWVYVCTSCGYLHWFLDPRAQAGVEEPISCMSCGKLLPRGESNCPACGWTYEE